MSYAELQCTSHFSFLRGASSCDELFFRAAELGIRVLAITDRNSLAGIVRAYEASRESGVRLIGGSLSLFGLIDADASALPSPFNPIPTSMVGVTDEFDTDLTSNAPIDHSQTPLHADDTQPVRIYSLTGSITDGVLETTGSNAGLYDDLTQVSVDKPALIRAADDILNLSFYGQNLRDADITSILAG